MKKYLCLIIAAIMLASCTMQRVNDENTNLNIYNSNTKNTILSFDDIQNNGNITCGTNTIGYAEDSLVITNDNNAIRTIDRPAGELVFECNDKTTNFYYYEDLPTSLVVKSLTIKGDEVNTDTCIKEVNDSYQVITTTHMQNGKVISENTGDQKIEVCESIQDKLFIGDAEANNIEA